MTRMITNQGSYQIIHIYPTNLQNNNLLYGKIYVPRNQSCIPGTIEKCGVDLILDQIRDKFLRRAKLCNQQIFCSLLYV